MRRQCRDVLEREGRDKTREPTLDLSADRLPPSTVTLKLLRIALGATLTEAIRLDRLTRAAVTATHTSWRARLVDRWQQSQHLPSLRGPNSAGAENISASDATAAEALLRALARHSKRVGDLLPSRSLAAG
jgi:hypothetical protein